MFVSSLTNVKCTCRLDFCSSSKSSLWFSQERHLQVPPKLASLCVKFKCSPNQQSALYNMAMATVVLIKSICKEGTEALLYVNCYSTVVVGSSSADWSVQGFKRSSSLKWIVHILQNSKAKNVSYWLQFFLFFVVTPPPLKTESFLRIFYLQESQRVTREMVEKYSLYKKPSFQLLSITLCMFLLWILYFQQMCSLNDTQWRENVCVKRCNKWDFVTKHAQRLSVNCKSCISF